MNSQPALMRIAQRGVTADDPEIFSDWYLILVLIKICVWNIFVNVRYQLRRF